MSQWAAGAIAFLLTLLFAASKLRYRALRSIPRVSKEGRTADCMVVIPARNEEAMIGRAVGSLPHDTVIVVDDGSEDGTAEVAHNAGAGVLPLPDLNHAGIGKSNACAAGAGALTSRWVLFTDADTWFEPGFLEAIVAAAETEGVSLLSIYLDPEYKGAAENTLVPYARALAFCGLGIVHNRHAVFNGQCLLARLESYKFIGTHKAVAKYLTEDVKLSMLAARHRLEVLTARAPGLGHVRLYQGYAGISSGLERHAFRFTLVNPLIGGTIILAALLTALWLPVLAWLVVEREWIAAGAFALVPTLLLRPWYPSWGKALLAPLAVYWILPALLGGLISAMFGWSIRWKGRTVRAVS